MYIPLMNSRTIRRSSGLTVGMSLIFGLISVSYAARGRDDLAKIETTIRSLRSLPDEQRAKVTDETALEIRGLSAGKEKVGLAFALSKLATEGDFGRDTLQDVTTTLAESLTETPMPSTNGQPYYGYSSLAQLHKYEGMKVNLSSPDYRQAVKDLDALDAKGATVDFTLKDLNGKQWTLSALRGKVVLVNFWATWCPPCRKEMPDIDALYKQFGPKGFVVLAISDEKPETVSSFIEKNGYSYNILLDPGRTVNNSYGVQGIPKSFIYDRRGHLVAQTIDMRTRGQFLALLAKAGLK